MISKQWRSVVLFVLSTAFIGCTHFRICCDAQIFSFKRQKGSPTPKGETKYVSTAIFPVGGRAYPDGYFYATLNVGKPPKPYHLDIDTGSDLTWIQCDAPCVNCLKSPHAPYKPFNNLVLCSDPLCPFIEHPPNFPCHNPVDQCDYEVQYADHGLSMGVLVKDDIHLQLSNRSDSHQNITFGCGYDQEVQGSNHSPFVDGVIGLGNGKSSILSQLYDRGVTRNVVGHCFKSEGGGYLFFGEDYLPSSGVTWVPMSKSSVGKVYSIGSATLQLGDQKVISSRHDFVFDSGSTYTYLAKEAYEATLSTLKKGIDSKKLEVVPEDHTLPICWKGSKPFKSIGDVKSNFKPLTLLFKKESMEMSPDNYLIISKNGNVCLGILDAAEAELGNLNVLGDISMLGKVVIYDNEKKRIGWVASDCAWPSKF